MMLRGEPEKKLAVCGWLLHAAGLAATVLSAAVVFWTLFGAQSRQLAEHAQRLQELEALHRDADAMRREHEDLQETLRDTTQRMTELRAGLAQSMNETEFFALLARLADRSDVRLSDYRPSEVIEVDGYAQMEVQVSGKGAYPGLCQFLEGLDQIRMRSAVSHLQVQAPKDDQLCPIDLTMVVYLGGENREAGQTPQRDTAGARGA